MTVAVKPAADPKYDGRGRRTGTAWPCGDGYIREADQARVDEAVTALAWSLYNPAHAKELAELAVKDTQLGNVPDKIIKKQRKTFGTLRDLLRVKSVGIIEEDKKLGIVKYAKPVGLVCAITPSTNPGATPVNKAMMAIKGRNAIIIAASPAGLKTTATTVDYMRAELEKIGLPEDLVQILPPPASKDMTQALMQAADLVVATGSQDNVRRAYSSGTPAIGVGTGNVPVIVDETADLDDAARKICASKIFDNATSCSSENSVILVDAIYDKAIAALERAGGYMASARRKGKNPGRAVAGRQIEPHADCARCRCARARMRSARCRGIEEILHGRGNRRRPWLSVFQRKAVAGAGRLPRERFRRRGHARERNSRASGARTFGRPAYEGYEPRARKLAEYSDVVRVLINQAHTFGNGGGFDNGLNFTLSMGCGTWGGNSITDNLNYRHFLNITHLVTTIPEDKPSEEELFGAYWKNIRPLTGTLSNEL